MATQLSDLLLNDRGFAFDPVGGDTFQLSVTGLRVVRLLQQGDGEEEILGHILGEYEVDENTARRDLHSFLRALEQLGWKP
ncbi:MAG TPA: PqqD family protein [Chthoniobacteraceae bacterium]|nr:PqqD family protein [Chthoniobacteraceae bacterium]